MPLLTAPLRLERCLLCRLLCGVSELLSVTSHDRCLGGSEICLSGRLSCGSPVSINLCLLSHTTDVRGEWTENVFTSPIHH